MRWLCAGAFLIATTGCFDTIVRSERPVAEHKSLEADDRISIGVLWGVFNYPHIDLHEVCPDGWSRIETEIAPLDIFMNAVLFLTSLSFHRQSVFCTKASSHEQAR